MDIVENEIKRKLEETGQPRTQHDWTVHSINIHGVFFERWCEHAVSQAPGWNVDAVNYPVEFPPPNGPIRGKESALDIRASTRAGDRCLSLLIECKKNNPEYINWVFFKKLPRATSNGVIVPEVLNRPNPPPGNGWNSFSSISRVPLEFIVADEARETRADYLIQRNTGTKTRTSNAAIQEAAYQVSLAKQAIVWEDGHVSRKLGSLGTPPPMPWHKKLYFPIIVTTAQLYLCSFDPSDVSSKTGEISFSNALIAEQQVLVYEYPLPRHLQFSPIDVASAYDEGLIDSFVRSHLLIVQSHHLPEFLASFRNCKPDPTQVAPVD